MFYVSRVEVLGGSDSIAPMKPLCSKIHYVANACSYMSTNHFVLFERKCVFFGGGNVEYIWGGGV